MPLVESLLRYRIRSLPARYGLAVVSIAVAVAISVALSGGELRGSPLMLVIMLLGWYCGAGPGVLAAVLATLAIDYYGYLPRQTLRLATPREASYVLTYGMSAIIVAWLTGRQRDALNALARQLTLLELTHDAVIARTREGVITFWNRGAAECFGWSQAEAVGKKLHELLRTEFPKPRPEVEADLARSGRWEGKLTHTTRDGSKVIVAARWSHQRDETGAVVGVLETNNDITEGVRADDAWRESQAELARVMRVTMLGEITASMAHEINQPLAAVVMNANAGRRWLEADPPNADEALTALRRIGSDGERAGRVVGRLRSLVRKQAPESARLDINEVIEDTLEFTRQQLAHHSVTVKSQLAVDLPSIVFDRVQLQQVLVNLILNAVDAMSDTEPAARLLIVQTRREDGHVAVSVSDNGSGIGAGDPNRVFEAFFSTKSSGLGLGLSVSRSILKQHGGDIWAENNPANNSRPAGATFHFSVPAGTP